ncbi:MAG TPA: DUF4169 family protein [Alphaproteobacteria bacterium]|nr:DUF4169 family protein [Alphaproteobacteria bacterium]
MAKIINLRAIRKRQAMEKKEREAAENRARFGRKTPEKRRELAEAERAAREHEGKKIDRD